MTYIPINMSLRGFPPVAIHNPQELCRLKI